MSVLCDRVMVKNLIVANKKGTDGVASLKFAIRHGEEDLFLGINGYNGFGGFGKDGGCVVDVEWKWDVLVDSELFGYRVSNRDVDDNVD